MLGCASQRALRARADHDRHSDALIGQLAGTKFGPLIGGGRLAMVSLVGTNDWQDYLDVGLQVLHLEHVQRLDSRMARIEALLERLVEASGTGAERKQVD
jgi:hypothetical protein